MLRTSFLVVLIILCAAAGWKWLFASSQAVQPWSVVRLLPSNGIEVTQRRELVEVLDRIVIHQYSYHAVYGRFSKDLDQVGFDIPASVAHYYEIRVMQANEDRLLVIASSEAANGRTDLVSVDDDFQLQANFLIPDPRPEYLRNHAIRHLQRLKKQQWYLESVVEQTVFKGFFRYSIRLNQNNEKVGAADGVLAPVMNMHIDGDEKEDRVSTILSQHYHRGSTGQSSNGKQLESQNFASFQETLGKTDLEKYLRNFSELEQIANSVPLHDGEVPEDILSVRVINREISSQSREKLVIEPVHSNW